MLCHLLGDSIARDAKQAEDAPDTIFNLATGGNMLGRLAVTAGEKIAPWHQHRRTTRQRRQYCRDPSFSLSSTV